MAFHTKDHAGPGLVAVLLITRSRPGPKLVFHYPEVPNIKNGSHIHDVDSDDSDTDIEEPAHRAAALARNRLPSASLGKLSLEEQPARNTADSETVLGYSVDTLEKLLSPGKWCDQKKFEVCVDGVTFLGHPVYALADGEWTAKPPDAKKAKRDSNQKYGEYHMYLDPGSLASTPSGHGAKAQHDFTHIPDSFESREGFAASMESTSTASAPTLEQMAMFHVVFALRPHGADSQRSVKAMYKDVAKVLSQALHYCQKQSNYVASESRRILALRAKAKLDQSAAQDLVQPSTETSELAWALKEVYHRISNDEVAGIRLNGMDMSLRYSGTENTTNNEIELHPLTALLLLDTKETLLHQLSHPDASPLAHFIRDLTPTKNLQKHAINLGMPTTDILYLAQHLIKWRKARVIMPLHQRNTYVVSPDAPLTNLPQLREKYVKLFPTLPSLPNMLKVLSGKPIKWGVLIPSRDHRGAYMEILAFLVRCGLVVQLKTYAWLRLPKTLASHPTPSKRPVSARGLLSPRLRPIDDDAVSVQSDRTTIPASRAVKRLSTETQIRDESNPEFVLIANPSQPSQEEGKLLEHLQYEFSNAEFRENFALILPMLDGEHAFEEMAAQVGLKRRKVEEWLGELEKKGWLMSVTYV